MSPAKWKMLELWVGRWLFGFSGLPAGRRIRGGGFCNLGKLRGKAGIGGGKAELRLP